MPTGGNMSTALGLLVRSLAARRGESKTKLTQETIGAVYPDGTYSVRGERVGMTGRAQLQVGDKVTAAWRGGKPYLIVAHQARRAQFGPSVPPGGATIVEVLFIAGAKGVRDVYYRNDKQVTRLNIRGDLVSDPDSVRWGRADNSFVVLCLPSYTFYIYKLNREPRVVLGDVSPAVRLMETIRLDALNIKLLNINMVSSNSATTTIVHIEGNENGYAVTGTEDATRSASFSGSLVVPLNSAVLKSWFDDGAFVDNVFGDYIIAPYLEDYHLVGDGSDKSPYDLLLSVVVDFAVVQGDGTLSGSFSDWTVREPVPPNGTYEIFRFSGSAGWSGSTSGRAGFLINGKTGAVLHRGTGMSDTLSLSETASAAFGTVPVLGPVGNFQQLQTFTVNPLATPPPDATFTGGSGGGAQLSFVPNLLDPTASPFIVGDGALYETVGGGSTPGPHRWKELGSNSESPNFEETGDYVGASNTRAVSTVAVYQQKVLYWDPKDPTKTRLWVELQREIGEVSGEQPDALKFARKVVILDGLFNLKRVLTDWRRLWFDPFDPPPLNLMAVGGVLFLSGNATHVLWEENLGGPATTQFFPPNPTPFVGDDFTQRRRILLANHTTGAVLEVVADAPGETTNLDLIRKHGYAVLGLEADMFYETADTEFDTPEGKASHRIVEAWDQTTKDPDIADAQAPTEDALLDGLGKLEGLGAVVPLEDLDANGQSRGIGGWPAAGGPVYHAVNDHSILDERDRSGTDEP